MPWDLVTAGVGAAATLCTTGSFVPQIVKIRRQGGRDLSYGMLFFFLAGVLLWLAYGVLAGARAVVLANGVTAVLVAISIGLKRQGERRPADLAPGAPRRLRIAIDMDDVIADTNSKHLRVYNEAFADRLDVPGLGGRTLEDAVPRERAAAARALVLEPDFFTDLAVMEDSQAVIRQLAERYEVFITSAAMEVPTSFAAKYAWLREHFPFIPPSHIVFCGDKSVLDADYLIDDTPRHFQRFRGTPLLFAAHHNESEQGFTRVTGWEEVRRRLLDDAGTPSAQSPLSG